MWNLKNDTNKFIYKTEQTYACQKGGWIVRKFWMDMYTLLYFKLTSNRALLYSPGNSAQCYAAAWMGVELWGEWIHDG